MADIPSETKREEHLFMDWLREMFMGKETTAAVQSVVKDQIQVGNKMIQKWGNLLTPDLDTVRNLFQTMYDNLMEIYSNSEGNTTGSSSIRIPSTQRDDRFMTTVSTLVPMYVSLLDDFQAQLANDTRKSVTSSLLSMARLRMQDFYDRTLKLGDMYARAFNQRLGDKRDTEMRRVSDLITQEMWSIIERCRLTVLAIDTMTQQLKKQSEVKV